MKTKIEKTWWQKLVELLVMDAKSARWFSSKPIERAAPDVAENDRVLTTLGDDDPAYRVLMNYAFNHAENNLLIAIDAKQPMEKRFEFLNRFAAVSELVSDIETARARLKDELAKKLAREKKE